jgi:hypothetical protein
MTDDK